MVGPTDILNLTEVSYFLQNLQALGYILLLQWLPWQHFSQAIREKMRPLWRSY